MAFLPRLATQTSCKGIVMTQVEIKEDEPQALSPSATTETPGLIGFTQLVTQLGVPASWLLRQVRDGNLPMLKMGQRRLFDVGAVRRELLDMASKKPNGAA